MTTDIKIETSAFGFKIQYSGSLKKWSVSQRGNNIAAFNSISEAVQYCRNK